MPTWCDFSMKAVAKDEGVLNRLLSILKEEDKEFQLGWTDTDSVMLKESWSENGFIYYIITGLVSSGCFRWFGDNGAINIEKLCKKLDIGVEMWDKSMDMCKQSWHLCRHNGRVRLDGKQWQAIQKLDENGTMTEITQKGGFPNYGKFMESSKIYGVGRKK